MRSVYEKGVSSRRILSLNQQDWSIRGILGSLVGVVAVAICLILVARKTVAPQTKVHAGGRLRVPPQTPNYLVNPWALGEWEADLQAGSSGSGASRSFRAHSVAEASLTPGEIYNQLFFRQKDCSIAGGIGDFSAYVDGSGGLDALQTVANFQTLLRGISGLTPNPPSEAFAKGCSYSIVGAMSTQSNIFTTQLANGNYVGASISNSGVNTYVSQQLNGAVTSTYRDTSNGSATSAAFGLGTADLNGDGVPDLVVSNVDSSSPTGNTIAVLLGKSDGTFQAPSYYALSSQDKGGFTLVDLNGDGKLDIVLEEDQIETGLPAGPGSLSMVFMAGKGDGTFAAPVTAAAIQSGALSFLGSAAVAAADVNGDGHIDVVDANGLVFLGDGKGNLQQVAASGLLDTTNASASGQYTGLAIGDFNGDGKPDLALTQNSIGAVAIALGNGDGTFKIGNFYATGENPVEISATDLDGDGNIDLVVGINSGGVFAPGSLSPGLTQFILGRGDGTFASHRYVPGGASSAISADFTGDGHTDVLGFGPGLPGSLQALQLSKGNSDGSFQPPVTVSSLSVLDGGYGFLLNGDLNGDGKQDVVAVSSAGGFVVSVLGNGDGTFQTPSAQQSLSNPGTVIQAVLGDFNGDGKLDMAMITVTASNNGVLYLFSGKGDGTFASPTTLDTYAANIVANQVQAIDLNGDGKLDLVTISAPQGSISAPTINIYLGNGNGTFTSNTIPSVGGQNFISPEDYFGAGDVNGDGIPDLIVAGGLAGQPVSAILLLGNGDGTFKAGTTLNIGNNYSPLGPIQIQDLNNDGKADLFYPIEIDHTIALGNGDGTFGTQLMVRVASTGSFISAEDLDGDGKTDILMTGKGGIVPILTKGYGASTGTSASTTALTISPNPATLGQPVTFTATVAASSGASGTPTGTVTFSSGSTNLGTGTLNGGTATFSTSSLTAGTYSITAVYGGDSTFVNSTSAAVSLTVSAAPTTIATTTTLIGSATNAAVGTNLTFTASVAAASGSNVPTGSVTFSDGTSQLGTGTLDSTGKATYSISSLAVGTHSITAAYGGNTSYLASTSTSVNVTITAAPPDFTISLAQTSGTVNKSGSATSTITVTPSNGFNQPVSLSCSGAPSNATCSISPASVTPSGTSPGAATLTVQTGVKAAALALPNSFERSSGSIAWSFLGGGGFLSFALLRRRRRPLWTRLLAISALSCGLIGAATGCGSSGHSTPGGTYTITVTATSGTDSHTANYSLTVQ